MITHNRRHPVVRLGRQSFYKIYNIFKKQYWKLYKPQTSGVKIMVFNSQGEILLVRIGYMHKLWVIPGGKLDRGEEPADAALRELQEEIGVQLSECKYAFSIYHEKQGKKDTIYFFEAVADIHDFTIDDEEIIDVSWFPLHALPELRAPRVDDALIEYNKVNSK